MTQDAFGEKLRFRIAPLLEMALSLLVILNPERFAPVEPWVKRITERLGPSTVQQLRSKANEVDFLAIACELDDGKLPADTALAHLSERNPGLGSLLVEYWRAFAPEVAATAGTLGESLQKELDRLRETDPVTFLTDFSDRVTVSGDGKALVLEWGKGMVVPLEHLEAILFVPSTFCPRRLMFYRHGAAQIFFYNPLDRESMDLPQPPESLVLGFSALADPTRLRLLKLIAREKLPAQEMARRLEVHESTVSRHLRFLVEAGYVAREGQEGKFIFYTLNLDRLDMLVAGLRGYLH